MAEISCENCTSACCRADTLVELTLEEVSLLIRGGTKLLTVAMPSPHDRDDVIYPIGHEYDPDTGNRAWILEKARPFEPLAANMGRYILATDCAYVGTNEVGQSICTIYEERPAICREFEMGGDKCQRIRENRGVEIPVEIQGLQPRT